jgi:hypothetical protein
MSIKRWVADELFKEGLIEEDTEESARPGLVRYKVSRKGEEVPDSGDGDFFTTGDPLH